MTELVGKTAVVTGGGRGIGKAIAIGLAEAGASVAVIGRTQAPLDETVSAIEQAGAHGLAIASDLTEVSALPATFQRVNDDLGSLDILVNSAGVQLTGPAEDVTEETWDEVIAVNLKAVFFCCQAAGRMMLANGTGKIINLGSTFSVTGFPEFAAYCASKGGVVQLTRSLASEWASRGINVNAIGPTAVKTEMNTYLFESPEFLDFFLPKIPGGKILEPEDIVGAAIFLASPASDSVHGHLLMVDGGYTAI